MKAQRSPSIDVLRGLAMALMALDHARDFLTSSGYQPQFAQMTNGLFVTRWISHLCAPIFLFLAGMGARLSLSTTHSRKSLAFFLVTRGLWLIILEATLCHVAWYFSFQYISPSLAVLWALGCSMSCLALLIYAPDKVIAGVAILMIFGHNLFDSFHSADFASFAWLWTILHDGGPLFSVGSHTLYVSYPLIPWIGVMAAGYVFGKFWQDYTTKRAKISLYLGVALLAAFAVLRYINRYGDPNPWTPQETSVRTFFSFLDCRKYPPSLAYLLVTMGISFSLLSLFERFPRTQLAPLNIFGRVPLFFYVVHLYMLHAVAVVIALAQYRSLESLDFFHFAPAGYGLPLAAVYAITLIVLATLYPICKNYAARKKSSNNFWLRYF